MSRRNVAFVGWLTVVAVACVPLSFSRAPRSPPPTYAAAPPVDEQTRATQALPSVTAASEPTFAASAEHAPTRAGVASDADHERGLGSEVAPPPTAVLLPFQQMSYGSVPLRAKASARRHGNLAPASCAKELRHWQSAFKRVGSHKGVATPTRVVGLIEGVKFRVPGEKSKFGILDCRLALTLVEFARFLRARDVTEVVVDNFYRLNARLPSARSKRSQHAYGLAIDLRSFRLADGRVWDVERDWGASTDTEACGPEASLVSPTEHTAGLRTLVCELYSEQIFSHHLTPSYDAAHRNHLHLDIKRGATTAMIK